MADEDKQDGQTVVPGSTEEPAKDVENSGGSEGEVHPLEPGGVRFNEVYRDMQDARREAAELRERVAKMEGRFESVTKPAANEPKFYSADTLQAAVDAGKISPAQMADQLAWQRKEEGKREWAHESEVRTRAKEANTEIHSYIEKVPALMQPGSTEFLKVKRVALEIADEMGKTVDDPIVQRRALREAFGPIDRLTTVRRLVDTPRGAANMDPESRGSGGVNEGGGKSDPLKGVPEMYKQHWKRLGYTEKQMIEEAKFIKPRRR